MRVEDLFEAEVGDGWGDPARESREQSFSWIHVPARGSVDVVILSERPVRYRGHWIEGRMRPCTGPSCIYCERRMGGQVRYAFSIYDLAGRCCGLLELGAGAAGVIKDAADREGRLRGLAFRLRKEGQRDRGRVLVEQVACVVSLTDLPAGEDPSEHLIRGWGWRPGMSQGEPLVTPIGGP